jgi:hypothetical protein
MNKNFEYAVCEGFLSDEDVSLLNTKFRMVFNDDDAHKIGSSIAQLSSKQVESDDVLSRVLEKIASHFTDAINVSGIALDKVWFVKSQSKYTDPKKLLPHFDKHRYLKAMVYLHDVVEDHGPIHFGRLKNPSDIDVRRKGLPSNYKALGLNTISARELKSNMMPILGSKGDAIFFDTNAAHCAGIVSQGFERHVIRFDFEVQGFNPRRSFFQRLLSAISSRFS